MTPESTRATSRPRPIPLGLGTRHFPSRGGLVAACWLVAVLAIPPFGHSPAARASTDSPRRTGVNGMPDPNTGSLLVSYFESFLRNQDVDEFRRQVTSRYLEGTLTRLIEAPDTQTRRAAVFALGLVGSYQANAAIARSLRDSDPTVRGLAENALWAVWFRADSPENNAALEQVGALISRHRYEEAISEASRVVARAPRFAEAYNQRAIAEFALGRLADSAEDCRKVLERNPYHIGALAGLAKCLLRLDKREEALEILRRSSRIQPYNDDLKAWITSLENGLPE